MRPVQNWFRKNNEGRWTRNEKEKMIQQYGKMLSTGEPRYRGIL
jgi:hypothetical protein